MNRFTTIVITLTATCLFNALSLASATAPNTSTTAGQGQFQTSPVNANKPVKGTDRLAPAQNIEPVLNIADLNRDFVVDSFDLMILLNHWGEQGRGERNLADIFPPDTGDYVVNFDDLMILLQNFGA